jgi:helix-turn-helix protein
MSESVIADFVASFNAGITPKGESVEGRILCSDKRLVLAENSENNLKIPISTIVDVEVGQVSPELGDYFDSTVTLAFTRDGRDYVAVIEADEDTISTFSTVLFNAILKGTRVSVKQPAQRGGRVTDETFEPATLALDAKAVKFSSDRRTITIELAHVTSLGRETRSIGDQSRSVLLVSHMHQGEALKTVLAVKSVRKLGILGRYLRLEYSALLAHLEDIELTDGKRDLLVALYSGADAPDISLASLLDVEPAQVTSLLNELEEDGLVTSTASGTELTSMGQVAVANNIEY